MWQPRLGLADGEAMLAEACSRRGGRMICSARPTAAADSDGAAAVCQIDGHVSLVLRGDLYV